MNAPLTVEEIDPRTLLVDLNIRESEPSKAMIASVKALGVLQPVIAVRTAEGEIRVRLGHKRTRAAIEANKATIPVIVVGDEGTGEAAQVDRLFRQYDENKHRDGLTAVDEAGFVAELLDLGMSAATIQRRARVPKVTVQAAQAIHGSPGTAIFSLLQGVAAVSATDAWAVGSYSPPAGLSKTMIVHWDGHAWTQVPSASPISPSPGPRFRAELTAVSASSAGDVWAVGQYFDGAGDQTLIEHWNGRAWRRVPSPDPGGFRHGNNLTSVTAISARDAWAVGWYNRHRVERTLILHWNGSSWKAVASPNPGSRAISWSLSAVSASSATNVWAVGIGGLPGEELQSVTLRC